MSDSEESKAEAEQNRAAAIISKNEAEKRKEDILLEAGELRDTTTNITHDNNFPNIFSHRKPGTVPCGKTEASKPGSS